MNLPSQPPTMAELCQQFPCAPEATALAAQYPTPSVGVAKLREAQMPLEAVQVLARFLPKDKAVTWAAQSARLAGERTGLAPEELTTLDAAETWSANPSEANKAAAARAATDLAANSPAYWTANAAAFADGVEMPEGELPLAGNNDLTPHFAAGAVQLSAAKVSPAGLPEIPAAPVPTDSLPQAPGSPSDGLSQFTESGLPASQLQELTPEQRAETTKLLEPFLELGIALAQTVPGWF